MQKESIIQKKTPTIGLMSLLLWCHQESNRGHKDFQSFALPTELWHLFFRLRVQRYALFLDRPNFSLFFLV